MILGRIPVHVLRLLSQNRNTRRHLLSKLDVYRHHNQAIGSTVGCNGTCMCQGLGSGAHEICDKRVPVDYAY
jgi:hypothetical protein